MKSTVSAVGRVVVVGPSLDSHGGIASVNRTLLEAGFVGKDRDGLDVVLHASICDGPIPKRALFVLAHIVRFGLATHKRPWALHAHMAFKGSFWRKAAYGRLARWRGGLVIYQIHPTGFWDYYESGRPIRRLAIRSTLRRADALIAITNDIRDKLTRIAPDIPCFVVPNPVGLKSPPDTGPRDPATIAFLGWLIPEKGVFELVDAVARLRARRLDVRLVLAGDRDDGRLRSLVARSGLTDAVEFPGWLSREQVGDLLGRATILALPSYTEGLPMVILEALECGTPIVASAVGGIPEILRHEHNALLIRPRSVDALADALERLLSDQALRDRMSQANRDLAREFNVGNVAAALRAIYRQTLNVA